MQYFTVTILTDELILYNNIINNDILFKKKRKKCFGLIDVCFNVCIIIHNANIV